MADPNDDRREARAVLRATMRDAGATVAARQRAAEALLRYAAEDRADGASAYELDDAALLAVARAGMGGTPPGDGTQATGAAAGPIPRSTEAPHSPLADSGGVPRGTLGGPKKDPAISTSPQGPRRIESPELQRLRAIREGGPKTDPSISATPSPPGEMPWD